MNQSAGSFYIFRVSVCVVSVVERVLKQSSTTEVLGIVFQIGTNTKVESFTRF